MQEIYNYISINCRGKENATKGSKIRSAVGYRLGDKSFRKVIQDINASKDFPELIGAISGKGENAGYFIPLTKEEKQEVIDNKRHRANRILYDCHIMEWKANL
jgi:hypothetical protein